jgi:hypothetical protein
LLPSSFQWKTLAKLDTYVRTKYAKGKEGYCHPGDVLQTLSKLREDPSTDEVSQNAVITVDVGDVTLVRGLDVKT